MTDILMKRENSDTATQSRGMSCEDKGRDHTDAFTRQGTCSLASKPPEAWKASSDILILDFLTSELWNIIFRYLSQLSLLCCGSPDNLNTKPNKRQIYNGKKTTTKSYHIPGWE